ncbi:MAG: hypothetical protein JWN08_3785 [Frankiales bacterium]|nr:hypothetical protein [Frankiales bacterium]
MIPEDVARPSSRAWTELLHAEVAYLLRTAGIDVLHIKGPTVALWLYEEGERAWGDVDVMVAPSQMRDALAVLRERGLVEKYPGVTQGTTEDHSVVLARTDPTIGFDEVDLHERFPGMEVDPERAFDELWRRREPAQLAHVDVWFPDLTTRALLIALHTARSTTSPKARTDLLRLLDPASEVDWEDVVLLARRVGGLPALRAGLELEPAGRDVVQATPLRDTPVSVAWRLRVQRAPKTAERLEQLGQTPWRSRPATVARWVLPAPAVMRMRDPGAAAGPRPLVAAYARRLLGGARGLPHAYRVLRDASRS